MHRDRGGLALGLGAYLMWGFLPLYFPLLDPAGPVEIIAHRVVWTLAFCLVGLSLTRSWPAVAGLVRNRATLARLALAGVLVATNWLVYVWSVLSGHTVDAALGYYINPIVTVVLAVVALHERLRRAQWVAVGLGGLAVVVLTAGVGRLPWVALVLAGTFGTYGFLKNRLGSSVAPMAGLAVETAVLTPAAAAWLAVAGGGSFAQHGPWHALALAGAGVVTALPLLAFAGAARRLPLSVLGLLQYLTPTLQFAIGVLVFDEAMPAARWWGFALVWLALAVLTADGLRAARPRPQPAMVSQ